MRRLVTLVICASAVAPPGMTGAQSSSPRWSHEFTDVAAACERSDGSVIATDKGDPSIVLLARDGSARRLSRRGNGPGEFQSPVECFAMAGDTVVVHDRAVGRYLLVSPGSNTVTTVSRPAALAGGWFELRGVDERGRFVFERSADSGRAAVIRWDRARNAVDTATVIPTGTAKSMSTGGFSLSRVPPFTPRAAAIAAPALGIAIVHAEPFAVETQKGGAAKKGQGIPFTPVAVDDRDIEQIVARLAPPVGTVAMSSTGQQVATPQRQWRLENFGLTRADIPARKPAFDHEGVFASAAGAVWIRLYQPSAAPAERYEVWTPAGQRGSPVALPAGRRLVGVGARAAYVVASDADGIQTIERVAISM